MCVLGAAIWTANCHAILWEWPLPPLFEPTYNIINMLEPYFTIFFYAYWYFWVFILQFCFTEYTLFYFGLLMASETWFLAFAFVKYMYNLNFQFYKVQNRTVTYGFLHRDKLNHM